MADNYIEKKMEERRSGARKIFRAQKKLRAVFITNIDMDSVAGTLASLSAAGDCKIAFAGYDLIRGREMAQKYGARFYPLSMRLSFADAIADARARFAPLEMKIMDC